MTATLPRAAVRALVVTLAVLISLACAQVAPGAEASAADARAVAGAPRDAAPEQASQAGEREAPGCRKSGAVVQQAAPGVRAGSEQGAVPYAVRDVRAALGAPADAGPARAQGRTPPGPDIARLVVLRL